MATEVPARRLMSASDAIAARVCHAAVPVARLDTQSRLPTVWQTLSIRTRVGPRREEEPMQELEQRAAWDGKIFVDGEFRTPDGGGDADGAGQGRAGAARHGGRRVGRRPRRRGAAAAGRAARLGRRALRRPRRHPPRRGRRAAAPRGRDRHADRARDRLHPRQGRVRGRRRRRTSCSRPPALTSRADRADHPLAQPDARERRRAHPARRRRLHHALELPADPRHARRRARRSRSATRSC